MPRVRVHNFAMSVDGYVAGPHQDHDHPLGVGGERLHDWAFATQGFQRMLGNDGGDTGVDHDVWVAGEHGIGATIMGRNMFGPVRGDWDDREWTGGWGDDPPYHHPVFVLTHPARLPVSMEGGTTFHFVTDGIESALAQAVDAADGADVRVGGGAATVREFLRAGLVDELHLAVVPILLGDGERLFGDLGDLTDRYRCVEATPSPAVTHVRIARR